MANQIIHRDEIQTFIDENGNEKTTIKSTTTKFERNAEPDYIKIYTKMWCEFNEIPMRWRELFFQLAIRMSYCDSTDLQHSQEVIVYGGVSADICKACGWTDKSTLRRGLKALCECGAIQKGTYRATYQINPNYASRGSWKYNTKLAQGGVEDLIATFSFKDKTVETKIAWADNGEDTETNEMYRSGLEVTKTEETVLKNVITKPITAEELLVGVS